jgi:hypothetical protein
VLLPLLFSLACAAPEKVLVLDLEAVGITADDAAAATRVVAAAADEVDGVEIMSAAELRRLAELDGTRAVAGCVDTDCMADIAGALGAQRIIFGSLSKLGSTTTVVLSLYDASTQNATRRSFDVASHDGLAALLRSNTAALLGAVPPTPSSTAPSSSTGAVVVTATGVGLAVLGTVTAIVGDGMVQSATVPRDTKETMRVVGLVGVAVGAVGVVVGVVGGVMLLGAE